MDSSIFNTDLLIFHLRDKIKELIKSIKGKELLTHFSEHHLIYMIRNKISSNVRFVILNELTQQELHGMKRNPNEGIKVVNSLKTYLFENYPKLGTYLQKVSFNGLLTRGSDSQPHYYEKISNYTDIEPTIIFSKAYKVELNYLKLVDLDYEYITLPRPYDESLMLFEQQAKALYQKFQIVESENDSEGLLRD